MPNQFARQLRKNMTDTERFVWKRIRYRQLGGYRFRRQVPVGPYIADFVCFEAKVVLELDGGQHATQLLSDTERTHWFEGQGFVVVRFWNNEAIENWDTIADYLVGVLQARTPHPNPPPQGGRGPERPPDMLRPTGNPPGP